MLEKRPYQEECLSCIAASRLMGMIRVLIVMATRLGKTITAALDVQRFAAGKRIRVLYLCHKNDILYQARLEFQRVFGTERTYGFFHGTKKDFENVDFLFASFDTIGGWLEMFDPEMFDYVIVDESHHSHAKTYLPTIEYFKPKFLLAITATPNRMDEKDITQIFGKPVYNLPLEKALALGYLAPVDYRILTDEIQTDKIIATPDKRWSISALNRQIFVPKRDEEIVRLIAQYTRGIKDLKMIVFCSSVKHCNNLVTYLPDSLAFHSRIPGKERDVRLEMFRQEMLNTVITVDCFNEGIDIPRANVIVFLRSTDSDNIFLQQLGRGLTKEEGKDRVLVLDFVANLERIKMVTDLVKEVERNIPSRDRKKWVGSNAPLTIDIGKVSFLEKRVTMLDLLDRIVKKEFYPTWQEAGQAAQKLGIKSSREYMLRYKEDPKLPSQPNLVYSDYPGVGEFLGTAKYDTWEEASEAAIALGIQNSTEYGLHWEKDLRLPSHPDKFYVDWPDWHTFFGRQKASYYPNLRFASSAVQKLGIKTAAEYTVDKKYKDDPKLPGDPEAYYASEWISWPDFFGTNRNFYPTLVEASNAAVRLGIKNVDEYRKRFGEDPRLHSNPWQYYPEWKAGRWNQVRFLQQFYLTWQEASKIAIGYGWTKRSVYRKNCSTDSKLPTRPERFYTDFPGWEKFLGEN